MIRTAVITRAADHKTPLLQVQLERDEVHYKKMTHYEIIGLIQSAIRILSEDEAEARR